MAALLLPLVLSQITTIGLARQWGRPSAVVDLALWWFALTLVALVVIEATLVVTRRLAPLAVLLGLNLAFPGVAPSRYRIALRRGSPRRLQREVERTDGDRPVDVATRSAVTLLELVGDLGRHDRRTRGHSERVRAFAELIGEELDLPEDERHRLRWGALLHDIGKLQVPQEILNKPGRLTPSEFEVIKRHPLDGLAIAMPLAPWLGDHLFAVSDHHERWEGGGYPSGAAGEDIALAGRIVAVADAYDVMTSARSYKSPISAEDACAELLRCSGTQFDPEVVRAFLAIPSERLRAVAGPLSALAPLAGRPTRPSGLRSGVRQIAAAAAVATVAATTAGPVDDVAPPVAAAPVIDDADGDADASGSSGRPGRDTSDADPQATTDRGAPGSTATVSPTGTSPADDGGVLDDPARDRSRDGSSPTGPGPAPGAPPPPPPPPPPTDPGPDGLGVRVDPSSGEIAATGLPIADEPLPLARLAPVGDALCAGIGQCDELVVETPIVLPQL